MKNIKFAVLGILFGILMVKSEIISWYRIYEMFRFDSFHMYGIIGTAVMIGSIGIYLIKRYDVRAINGEEISISPKQMSIYRYLLGGMIFGLGWALVGACPGPMFVLLGAGYAPIIIVIMGAIGGTFLYGLLRNRLPH